MSKKTKLYENLKNEAVRIPHWQDLRHCPSEKGKIIKYAQVIRITAAQKKSKSTTVGQVETYLADKKANLCAAQYCFSF